jgi:hypothetical protein
VAHRNVWLETLEQKKPFRRPRYGWENAIKMDLNKWNRRVRTGFRIGTDFGVLRIGKFKLWVSIKCEELFC